MIVFRTLLFLFVVCSLSFVCLGQTNSQITEAQHEREREQRQIAKQKSAYEQKILGGKIIGGRRVKTRSENGANRNDRKYPSEEELAVISPEAKLVQQYKDFLKSKNTGMIRLVSDNGCGSDRRIVKVEADCVKFENIPGYGSTYSFRTDKYVLGRYSDIVYKNGVLYSFGSLTTGFFTELGDLSVADITSKTNGARFTYSFIPKNKFEEIEEQNNKFVKGITSDGFIYKKSAKLTEGQTYLLRSVAYKAKKKFIENGNAIVYDNTDYDSRRDSIVAFRVIEIDIEGGVTLLWKVLQERGSPKVSFQKTVD